MSSTNSYVAQGLGGLPMRFITVGYSTQGGTQLNTNISAWRRSSVARNRQLDSSYDRMTGEIDQEIDRQTGTIVSTLRDKGPEEVQKWIPGFLEGLAKHVSKSSEIDNLSIRILNAEENNSLAGDSEFTHTSQSAPMVLSNTE
ncbi:hypothetical protein V866_006593 [Kwoniella sp. B9012]